MSRRLAQLTPLGGGEGGGVSVVVEALSRALLADAEYSPNVFCANTPELLARKRWDGIRVTPCQSIGPARFGFLRELPGELTAFAPDIIHIHGVWTALSYFHQRFQRSQCTPYVISPHGMLDSWALQNSKWKKVVAGKLCEREHLSGANALIALCESEAQSIRAFGLKNPVVIIPNGIDLPDLTTESVEAPWAGEGRRALLFLGRIHPKKGLPLLLSAWAEEKKKNPRIADEWFLAIGGWSEVGHIDELKQQAISLNISKDVRFLGSLYGKEKDAVLRNASAYVLPSYSEGLPMSVLEAWSYKLPSLITPECNLSEGFTADAALRIDTTVASVQDGLRKLFMMSEQEREVLGSRAYDLVREQFTWDQIAKQTVSVYDWLLGGGDAPESVRFYE